MPKRLRAVAFDVDATSLISFRNAFPGWDCEVVTGATAASLNHETDREAANLFVVGARDNLAETLGLCRELRSQRGRADTPILVLVPPAQPALVTAVLKAGASGCLILPVHAKEMASSVRRTQEGNQPGRHTLNLDRAQREDRWRDDGGQG